MAAGTGRFMNIVRSFSMSLTGRRERLGSKAYRLLACGPSNITEVLQQTFRTETDMVASATLNTLNMSRLRGLIAGINRLSVMMNDAFILVFYMDDEDCFQTISAFRERIIEMKGEDVPLLVVGYNRATSAPRIMGPETADCLVTIEWGLKYKEASVGHPDDLKEVLKEMFNIIAAKQSLKSVLDRRMTSS